jgi:predicted NAD/FAD-dependent oxidoreductase
MSTLGKALAADLPIHRQQRAIVIAPAPNGTWHLTTETGDTDHPIQHWHTKALVLAMPAPQILPLLATLPPDPRVTAALENLALGTPPLLSVQRAKHYVTTALTYALAMGQGPVGHFFPLLQQGTGAA